VGLAGPPADWHARHLGKVVAGVGFAPLADEEVPAVTEYLKSFVGAPRLMAGKRLFAERGCRGCHRVAGVGGEDGPDLSEIGLRRPDALPRAKTRGEALAVFHRLHLLDPPGTVKGSRMPKLGLTPEEADVLAGFLVSLRPRALPEGALPKDRVQVALLGQRDFATDGASLFAAFCSACHGTSAQGRTTADELGPVPSLGNPDALALADDAFLTRTIERGRAGRRMQAWANHEGGLRAEEIAALVGFLRSLEPKAPTFAEVMAAAPDLEAGRATFGRSCAPCHGEAGQGSVVAPPLAAEDDVVTVDDNRIYGTLATGVAGTAMGAFRRLDAGGLRSVIAAVRALPRLPLSRKDWKVVAGDPRRGKPLFAKHCARCHGASGQGDKGPALTNPALLATASDGFLAGTILRGRPGTPMPTFGQRGPENEALAPGEVADVVAFLRSGNPSIAAR
jgi:mono/diheme cytochrome c family protein